MQRAALLVIRAVVLATAMLPVDARAEEARIYGIQMGTLSPHPGAFKPAKSDLHCYSMNENRCWDGKAWHDVYPLGKRRYAKPSTDMVACVAIMKANDDCWDGANWYRLPPGTLSGIVAGELNPQAGAFITAPLR